MNSDKNLEYLYSLTRFGIKTGLDNISLLCRELGNPQDSYPLIHIAGTNGKGSTGAMLQSIFIEGGYRCGLYTSPHLAHFGERIRVNHELLTDEEASGLIDELRSAFDKTESTFFESTTAMAFLHFARRQVDIAVVETGLGGSLDATNIVKSIMSVFTPISLDHTERLGNKLASIAGDKAGIIKPGTSVVSSRQEAAALEQLQRRAGALGCDFHYGPEEARIIGGEADYLGSRVELECPDYPEISGHYTLGLPGKHQWINLQTALTAVMAFGRKYELSPEAVKRGLEKFHWEGRLQILRETPLVYYDVAHNPAAAGVVADFFREQFPGVKVRVALGIVAEKDVRGVLGRLCEVAEDFTFVELDTDRSMPPRQIAEIAREMNLKYMIIDDAAEAVGILIDKTVEEGVILVTGSHYLGEALFDQNLT